MRRAAVLLGLILGALTLPSGAQADFGIAPGTLSATALNRDGTIDTQTGSHPYSFAVHFELNTSGGHTEGGELREVLTDLPPGLFGNPQAVPSCPRQSFEGAIPNCAPSTQVGVLRAILPGIGEVVGPLYNLTPPPGLAAQLGFSAVGLTALLSASVRSEEGYGVHIVAADVPLEVSAITATIWGAPADPGHTPERGTSGGIASDAPLLPFLTLPTSCLTPPEMTVKVNSKLSPSVFDSETVPTRDKAGNPVSLSGCDAVPFSPAVLAAPTTQSAGSASGLGFQLKLPNQGLLNPKDSAVAETQPEKTEVTLPPGVAVNPSAANGIVACALVQFKAETAESPPGQGCPHASSVGTLVARTPLLEEAIEGSVYLAAPHDNPFNSLLALYVIARAPERGVLVKQAGEVHADPVTGQLTTTFDHLPPLPYSSFQLNLREGPRAPLVTPQTCGTYLTEAKLYSFSNPGIAVERSAPFEIASGAIGGACASSEAQLPNKPSLEAGTLYPIAGAYSPLLFKLSREDGSQRLASIAATLPAGLTGKLAGIPYCPETSIAAAAAKSQEGEGARELSSPSCPPASQVATVNVSAGAGPEPYPTQGKAYLAGPYKGAPLSLAIITPAIAGPFDLGVVVVRTALNVDPVSAQINAVSDPLPTVLHGIPLDIRSVSLQMNRRDFTLNPTSCEAKSITGQATSALGQVATLSNRFQVGACGALAFKPALKIELKGQTKRGGYPKLRAVLKVQAGAANIAAASVALPHSEFLAQEHIETICTRVQFAAGAGNGSQCPPRSVYGRAKAFSPLLDQPLSGPVYLRSSSHSLPDLVAALHGQIEIVLDGRVDSVNGGIRNSFRAVPDAPVSKFVLEMQGGKKGLLVNSTDICKGTHRAVAVFGGQNGKRFGAEPALRAGCSKRRKD